MKVFAISDHHFGHRNILKYYDRGTKDVDEDAWNMIRAHNAIVGKDDTVFFVGDVSHGLHHDKFEKLKHWVSSMNGNKILVRGNHDKFSDEEYLECGFSSVHEIVVLKEQSLIFCHFPDIKEICDLALRENYTLIHGHTHRPNPPDNFGDKVSRLNVCREISIEPISLFEE